ncbi:MAG TPA: HNH endonuclease signature motif containing protein [Ramlibacter sp.]|jgi:5-methylcytosine-specific restriction endonuclease McrA|uniref:HNH endonuclease n=1 Tax=Ramlibacter sp. TaxID=1917967 RepID=UPI002D5080AD|nr:HNH endonuclease signature motif containing protein [Ramlibacter sp.]HZY18416.1 HNH endonuclease signature motif containing protein [Ramlibacter sp.]
MVKQTRAMATGRIKRRRRDQILDALPPAAAGDPTCPLCGRPIPPSQRDAHHLVPKSQGGRETALLHRICHRQVHALLSEAELARDYASAEALLAHPDVAKFVDWVRTKPPDFMERTRRSSRRRGS